MSTELNYWFDTSQFRLKLRSELPKQADTIIIGGGIAGISTLYLLRQMGIDAILLDKNDIGFRCSGRNNGNVSLPQFFNVRRKDFSVLYRVAKYNNQIIKRIIDDLDIKCGLGYAGEVQLYIDKKPTKIPDNYYWLMNSEEIDFLISSKEFQGGLYLPISATCNTYQLLHGLMIACEIDQNVIFSHVDVTQIDKRFGKIYIHTSDDHILSCKNIVLCTNSHFGLDNLKSKSITRKIISGVCYQAMDNIKILNFPPLTLQIIDNGLRLRVYDRRVFIDHDQIFNLKELHKLVSSFFPILKEYNIQYYWSDYVSITKDKIPLIGKLDNNIYVSSLFGRNAMAFCFAGAEIIANYIVDNKYEYEEMKIFEPQRFKKGVK